MIIDPNFYTSRSVGSTPKAPLDPGTVEFIKGKPAIVEPATKAARDWRYYESTIIASQEMTGRILKEYKEGATWKEHYKTWQAACEPLGKSRSQIDRLIQEALDISALCADKPNTSKSQVLAIVNDLPDPLAELEAQMAKATVHAGPLPDQPSKPKATPKSVEERQPREHNNNGKPIYALPVWNEMHDYCGKLLNRIDAAHHVLADKQEHDALVKDVHDVDKRIKRWHERAKKV